MLDEFGDGVIPNNNMYVLNLFNSINLNEEEFDVYDSMYFYSKEELTIQDMDSKYPLFLNSKTYEFVKYFERNDITTSVEICSKDGNIKISKEDIETMIYNQYLKDNFEHQDFVYTHYIDYAFSVHIRFVYSDNYYASFCDVQQKMNMKVPLNQL